MRVNLLKMNEITDICGLANRLNKKHTIFVSKRKVFKRDIRESTKRSTIVVSPKVSLRMPQRTH